MGRQRSVLVFMAVFLLATACTKVPQADDCQVASLVQRRIAKRVSWHQETAEDQQVEEYIEQFLQRELTLDAAVQMALLNNPQIQAVFEDLGIAQADLVQAGLFQNPIFEGFVRFPSGSFTVNTGFSVTKGFLDIFLIPLRKKIANTELEQAQFRVAQVVVDLAYTVQQTYYCLQAEQKRLALLDLLVDATDVSYLLAQKQYEAGNISSLDLQSHKSRYFETKLELAKSQNQVAHLRKKMNEDLGLRPFQASWSISNELLELPSDEISVERLEMTALSQRLDVAHARLEVKRFAQMGAMKKWWTYTDAAIGISGERDTDGAHVLGPVLSTTLPFFNYGQADRARLFSLFKQSQYRLQALEVDILSQIRMVTEQLHSNRTRVLLYLNEYLPLQNEILASSQNFYNVMGLSIYRFLQNKQQALQAQIGYIESLREYWITRAELDRAVGGTIQK